MRVTGRVLRNANNDAVGIGGVAISDGVTVVRSSADGSYSIDCARDAAFVFMSLPSGFRIPVVMDGNRACIFRPLNGDLPVDFCLEPDDSDDAFTFLYVTDLHLDNDRQGLFESETLPDISALNPAPRFILFGGDISIQGKAEERFVRAIATLRVPCFNAVGNHELLVREGDAKARFKQLFGPPYYSFNSGGVHFVVLDGTRPEPAREGWKNVVGHVGAAELSWLRQDLASLPAGTPVILFSHIPIVSTYSERRGLSSATAEPAWEITNAAEVIEALSGHRVLCVLQGHMHENEHLFANGIHFITSGATCGKWWRSIENPDGTPRGYRIVRVAGSDWSSSYRCTAPVANQHMAVRVAPPEEWMGRPARVDVNVFDGCAARDRVLCRAGDKPAWELAPVAGVVHRWSGCVPLGESETRHIISVTLQRDGAEIAAATLEIEVPPWKPGH